LTLARFTYLSKATAYVLEVESNNIPQLSFTLLVLQEDFPSMLTITAIALAAFKLFVATDIKRVVSTEDIIEGAQKALTSIDIGQGVA